MKNSGFVGVALSVAIVLLLLSSVSNAQVVIITQPMNVTVCLTQSTTANFTCVVDTGGIGISSAGWEISVSVGYASVSGRDRHMTDDSINGDIITDTLTVTNVSLSDNGAQYRCEPLSDVTSDVVSITVLALPPDAIEATEICTNDFTVSWNFTEGLTYVVEVLPPSMMDGMAVGPMMDTFYTFHELLPNTVYRVSVTSRMDTCLGIPNTIMITTLTEQEGLPQSVSNLRNSSTEDTITIEWNSASGNSACGPVSYIVTVVNLMNGNVNNFEQRQNKIDFTDLRNSTMYNITVVAVNRAGNGESSAIVVTGNAGENTSGNGGNDDGGDGESNTGAIIGGIIGGLGGLIIISTSTTVVIMCWRNNRKPSADIGKLPSSNSSESPNATPVHDAPQYADLHHGKPGDLPPTDHSKVAYTQVKEHEPLNYAQVQHEPGSDTKPVQGAPPVEYREVWHEQ